MVCFNHFLHKATCKLPPSITQLAQGDFAPARSAHATSTHPTPPATSTQPTPSVTSTQPTPVTTSTQPTSYATSTQPTPFATSTQKAPKKKMRLQKGLKPVMSQP